MRNAMTDREYRHLLQTFPRMVREVIDGRSMLIMAILLLAFSTLLSSRSLRLWAMATSALLGPLIASVLLIIRPLNPYDNIYARIEGKTTSAAKDSPYARELIDLLKSSRGTRYVVKLGLVTAVVLLGCFLAIASIIGNVDLSFDRTQDFNWILGDSIMLFAGCLGVEITLLLKWAIKAIKYQPLYDDLEKPTN